MKQLLSLFLFLVPCLAWAQYPSNGNQKITLGEQTTADGLIFRGVLADTGIITPSSDTSAYIILDTVNHRFYNYNRATNVWSVAGGGTAVTTFSGGTTGLTPSTATSGAVTLGGTLALANGGTGSATQNFVDLTTTQSSIAGEKTFTSAVTATRFNPTANTATGTGMFAPTSTSLGFSTNGTEKMRILSNGNVGIGVTNPVATLDIGGIGAGEIAMRDLDGTNLYLSFGHNNGESTFNTRNGNSRGSYNFYSQNNTGVVSFMYIDITGKMGIGTVEPSQILHVVGNARITAVGAGAYSNDLNITSTGVLTTASSSDETFKYNINPIAYGLETILQLKPVSFQWKKGDEHDLGFIAQDAVNIIPEAVDTFWDSSLLFRSNTIIPILTKAIQEQQALIKALEQRIINLENK